MKKIILFISLVMVALFSITSSTYAMPLDTGEDFSNSKISFLGDSLTAGSSYAEEYRWPYIVANELGFESYVNMGLNGSAVAQEVGRSDSFYDRVDNIPTDSDYVVIMGGVNDMSRDVPIADFENDLSYVISYLRTNLPTAQIIVMTYFDCGFAGTNTLTLTRTDYYDVVRTVADDHIAETGSAVTGNVQMLDMFNVGDVTTAQVLEYTYDGTHPNVQGNRIIANMLISFLAGENLNENETYISGILLSDGTFDFSAAFDDYEFTERIDVTAGKSYVIYANGAASTDGSPSVISPVGVFYDADGTLLEAASGANHLYHVVTAPATADYMILNLQKDNENELFVREIITEFSVDFNANGGTVVDTLYAENAAIIEPTEPTLEGYSFVGWYSDEDFTVVYDFDELVEDNITLYAKWNLESTNTNTTTIITPADTLSFLGFAWYWWALAAASVYYLGFTKSGKKTLKMFGLKK